MEPAGLGIETGGDLRSKSPAFLQQDFGSSAEWYHAIARGQDHRPVNPDRVRMSSGSETTFREDLTSDADIEAGVLRMANDVWAWREKRQAFGRTATVKVKYGGLPADHPQPEPRDGDRDTCRAAGRQPRTHPVDAADDEGDTAGRGDRRFRHSSRYLTMTKTQIAYVSLPMIVASPSAISIST